LLADLFGCPADVLRGRADIERTLKEAAQAARATIVDTTFHEFSGGGVTGVVAVKESHLTIHTWPEQGYAAVDIFLCGDCDPRLALEYLQKAFHPKQTNVQRARRGRGGGQHGKAEHADLMSAAVATPAAGVAMPTQEAVAPSDAVGSNAANTRMPILYALTLTVAACSIIYELLLAQTLSALLGNTVLRYSITIGCYLGALGIGAMVCAHDPPDPGRRLMRTELALSLIGGLAVPLFYFLDVGQRYFYIADASPVMGTRWGPLAFLIATHAVIIGIGFLSGLEVPLLLAMGRARRRDSTNLLLGTDYVGALIGSILFPIVFLRTLGLIATGFLVATLNAVACVLIVLLHPARASKRLAVVGLVLAAGLLFGLSRSNAIEQYFLKKFYYGEDVTSLSKLIAPQPNRPPIQRFRSMYQTIDIYPAQSAYQWVYNLASTKMAAEPQYPNSVRLYLNRDYQVYSGVDEFYHEWFVHAPIQSVGHAPESALVLGGGDGLALRELVAYDSLERIVHVELDPEMIRLADEHPLLSAMNGDVQMRPRIETVNADAFHWLRTHDDSFDAIYVDMPYPRDYNLAQVYSREFYALVRRHLKRDGFLALDAPDGSCHLEGSLWPIYYNTLRSAGFETVLPVMSRLDLDSPLISDRLTSLAARSEISRSNADGVQTPLNVEQRFEVLRASMSQILDTSRQEFLLAFPHRRDPNTEWIDYGIPLYAFGPEHLALAFQTDCTYAAEPDRVNSIFRPTLPPLTLLDVQFP